MAYESCSLVKDQILARRIVTEKKIVQVNIPLGVGIVEITVTDRVQRLISRRCYFHCYCCSHCEFNLPPNEEAITLNGIGGGPALTCTSVMLVVIARGKFL